MVEDNIIPEEEHLTQIEMFPDIKKAPIKDKKEITKTIIYENDNKIIDGKIWKEILPEIEEIPSYIYNTSCQEELGASFKFNKDVSEVYCSSLSKFPSIGDFINVTFNGLTKEAYKKYKIEKAFVLSDFNTKEPINPQTYHLLISYISPIEKPQAEGNLNKEYIEYKKQAHKIMKTSE